MKKLISLSMIVAALAVAVSCHKSTPAPKGTVYLDLPSTPYAYFDAVMFGDSLNNKATLGRVLFYDGNLSVNNVISCASCHKQQAAFADNVAFSTGFEGRKTGRNSKGIQNLGGDASFGFNPAASIRFSVQPLFWDGREDILMNLVNRPITNHVEMGISDPATLPAKLAALPYYNDLFQKAYGNSTITSDKISECIAIFMTAIKTGNSKFEIASKTGNFSSFSPLELQGQQLFIEKYNCQSCHHVFTNVYSSTVDFRNIGLDEIPGDKGRGAIVNNAADNGKFRVPTLENVALTAPYMHDGRFKTLDEVIDHYSNNIKNSANLDPILRDSTSGNAISMNISAQEKKALIAFLNTFTDNTVITDSKLSNPFKVK